MSEDETTPQVEHAEKLLAEVNKKLDGHRHMTDEQLHKTKQELQDAIAELGTRDKQEKEELRQAIASINEFIEKQRKDAEEKDKVHETSTTIVIPPSDIPPANPQHHDAGGGEPVGPGAGDKRRGGWRHIW